MGLIGLSSVTLLDDAAPLCRCYRLIGPGTHTDWMNTLTA